MYFFTDTAGTKINDSDLTLHEAIVCDGCDGPIYGFRYKCVQCHDYDLCRHCEARMLHKEHLMIRIPATIDKLPRKIDRNLNLGRVFESAGDQIRKFKREEEKWRREEEKLRREAEKEERKEEKCRRRHHRRR